MDPRNSINNNPFARPLSQPNGHHNAQAPVPPPPYTLQAPIQQQPSIVNDPFLPRRQEQGDARLDIDRGFRHGPPGARYATSLPRDALGTATENYNRMQDNGGGWRFADRRADHFSAQVLDGKSQTSTAQFAFAPSDRCVFPHCSTRPMSLESWLATAPLQFSVMSVYLII